MYVFESWILPGISGASTGISSSPLDISATLGLLRTGMDEIPAWPTCQYPADAVYWHAPDLLQTFKPGQCCLNLANAIFLDRQAKG